MQPCMMAEMKHALLGHRIVNLVLHADRIEVLLDNGETARLMFKSETPVELDVVWVPSEVTQPPSLSEKVVAEHELDWTEEQKADLEYYRRGLRRCLGVPEPSLNEDETE